MTYKRSRSSSKGSTSTLPPAIIEKFENDRRLALASGEQRACGSKIRYGNIVLATKAAYNLEVKSPGDVLDPYECPWCGAYHIGHQMDEAST